MSTDSYEIRTMTREEVDLAVDWAAHEGWNPGLHDADAYYAADPNGFFVGLLDGQPIAAISAIRYSDDFGFIGFYLVKPGSRGKGYGLKIWNAALEYLKGCTIGLDGVIDQQDNYRKSGFELAHRNIRYGGRGGIPMRPDPTIVELGNLPIRTLNAYANDFFPVERPDFTEAWLHQADSHPLGIISEAKMRGYGVIRKCREGHKIAPLFADSADIAKRLFLALQARVKPGDAIFMDVPEVNPAAIALAERHRLEIVFETARMYTGTAPDLALDRTYGITSFEVG